MAPMAQIIEAPSQQPQAIRVDHGETGKVARKWKRKPSTTSRAKRIAILGLLHIGTIVEDVN
jgi:hypothetical protein